MALANAIHKLSDIVNRVCCVLCIIMLTAMVAVTGAQIICRVFFTALSWSEETTRYLLVWSTFIGGGIVYKHSGHISVTLLQGLCPASAQKYLKILVHVICGIFCAIAVFYGFKYIGMQGRQLSAALRIPMRLMYISIPIGCLIILLHAVDGVVWLLTGKEADKA